MPLILTLVPDLMFSSRIEDVARRLGYEVDNLDLNADFAASIADKHPSLVLLTFDRTGDAWTRLATAAQQAGVRAVAFGSHMNVSAFKQARELGCQEVVANSRMNAELPNLLQKWVTG